MTNSPAYNGQPRGDHQTCECWGMDGADGFSYDMATGDWEVTLSNQTAPVFDPEGNEIDYSDWGNTIWPWGGPVGSICYTHQDQWRQEVGGEPGCGQFVANPQILPSPFPSELPHGGRYSGEWLAPPDPDSKVGTVIFGTECRPSNMNYCNVTYAEWDDLLHTYDRTKTIEDRLYLHRIRALVGGQCQGWGACLDERRRQGATGNNSGYSCAEVTEVEINGKTLLGGVDIEECICVSDGCDTGGPRTYPNTGGMIVGTKQDEFDKYGDYPFGNLIDPCACVKWSVTWKGTSTPPTVDNCRGWTFEVGGWMDDYKERDPNVIGLCKIPSTVFSFLPRFCFYAESFLPGHGYDDGVGVDATSPEPPFNETRAACCGCGWACGCGQNRSTACGTAECTKGDGGNTPGIPGINFAIEICLGCLQGEIDNHGNPGSPYPTGICDEDEDVKFECDRTEFDGDCGQDDPPGDPPGDPVGACCRPGGECIQTTQARCLGEFKGGGVPCVPNPCDDGGGGPGRPIIYYPTPEQNHPLAPRGAPVVGPGFYSETPKYMNEPEGSKDCTYICFDGVWYPLDDRCDDINYKLPNVEGTDGQTMTIRQHPIGMKKEK